MQMFEEHAQSLYAITPFELSSECGIANWCSNKRPFLTGKHAAMGLAWCLKWRHWTVDEWVKYMWSDECSIDRGRHYIIRYFMY